jgi:hypothetical protein
MKDFSTAVENLLLKAGWYKGRKIDVGLFRQSLKEDGFTLIPIVEEFLREFGGLRIFFDKLSGQKESFHFDAQKATEGVHPAWAQKNYADRLNNKTLCIIGEGYSDHLTLMMDINGKVYGGYDDILIFIAENGRDAIEAICADKKFEHIP